MLANNGNISVHQITRLLFADWIARQMLLLPYIGAGMSGLEFLAAAGLGILWTFLYVRLLAWLSGHVKGSFTGHLQESFTGYLRERVGICGAYAVGLLMILFLLLQLVYLARLAGSICKTFLLPETSENIFLACTLLAGAAAARSDGQVRGRMAEIFFLPVAAALAIMLLASAGSVRPEHLAGGGSLNAADILNKSGAVFGSFFEVTLILYELPQIRDRGNGQRSALRGALQRGVLVTAIFLLAVFGIALGVFGEASFARLPFPVLTLMSSAALPGGFLQRWDAVFLAFLLPGLFLSAGSSFHYLARISGELFREGKSLRAAAGMFAAALILALLAGSYENAVRLYFRWGICCLVPLAAAAPVFLSILERVKKKCGS